MRTVGPIAIAALLTTACELQEITIAEADPFVVVETFVVAGDASAVAAAHASVGGEHLLQSFTGMQLSHGGEVAPFAQTGVVGSGCLAPGVLLDERSFPGGLACFEAHPSTPIAAGALYRMDVELEDGSRLSGATRVPEQVAFTSDAGSERVPCYLEPWTQAELSWNATTGAAAFILDLRAFGVRAALEAEGIEAEDVPEPLILRGLAIGNADTTIVLPAEFGLFDRFSLDPALTLALQRGMPPGINFDVTVAAVDQNFVDWVRGGDFNPSGLIRTPSLFGEAGTGALGSMTIDVMAGTTNDIDNPEIPPRPRCVSAPTS